MTASSRSFGSAPVNFATTFAVSNGRILLAMLPLILYPRVAHDRPRISRRFVRVNENDGVGALRSADFVFVGPASVVRSHFAFEQIGLLRVCGRIVDEHDQRFAVRIEAFVIVPPIFGRDDAVADEDQIGADRVGRLLRLIGADEFIHVL
jgi:hypothetical protein